jgi:lipopolysaccharide transport system permease protein
MGSEVKLFRLAHISKDLHLLFQLVKRDFSVRFTGSALGFSWAILQPLSLVLLYWFVFTIMIPRAPMAGTDGYMQFLVSGLLPWLAINEGVLRSTTSIVENAPMVRRLAMKSEVLVIVPNLTAAIFELIGLALFIIFLVARGSDLGALWVLPFALVLQLMFQVGLGFFLAPFYVFFRDVLQVLGFALSIVFYLSPILYPIAERFKRVFDWNPLTPLLGLFRSATIGSPLPNAASIVFLVLIAAGVLAAGWLFFRRMQGGVVDLI